MTSNKLQVGRLIKTVMKYDRKGKNNYPGTGAYSF